MSSFTVTVWYRYVVNNEIEKDFSIHEIEATTEEEAKEKAILLYSKSRGRIPFGEPEIL